MIAWVIVIVAFFILAVQMFVTILEFKLTSLAGFVLVPFALWNRTCFLAERVLGNVISSGHQGDGARRHRRHRLQLSSANSSARCRGRSPTSTRR